LLAVRLLDWSNKSGLLAKCSDGFGMFLGLLVDCQDLKYLEVCASKFQVEILTGIWLVI